MAVIVAYVASKVTAMTNLTLLMMILRMNWSNIARFQIGFSAINAQLSVMHVHIPATKDLWYLFSGYEA